MWLVGIRRQEYIYNHVCTWGGEKGSGQLAIGGDVFDLLDHIHQPPNHRRDSPVAQNPAEKVGKESMTRGCSQELK